MKALKLLSNQELEVLEVSNPVLEHNHSIVRILYVGLCSSDIARTYMNGSYSYPITIGHEAVGIIEETYSKNFLKGDRVVIFPLKPCFSCLKCRSRNYQLCENYSYYGSREDGAMQELLSVSDWNLIKISNEIDAKDAALTEPTAIMVHVKNILFNSINRSEIEKNFGAILGGGFLAMLFSRILSISSNAPHIVFERNEFKRIKACENDIKAVPHNLVDDKKYKNYFKWVIDASGDPHSFQKSIDLCMPGGTIILMSNIYSDVNLSKRAFSDILRKELTIKGSWNSTFDKSSANEWSEALDYFKKGLSPSKFVTHTIGLNQVDDVIQSFYKHKQRIDRFEAIKALVKINNDNST